MKVSISRVCDDARPAVFAALASRKMRQDGDAIIILPDAEAKDILQLLEKALAGTGYVAAENMQEKGEIAILKSGEIEQLGLYLCGYCAMVFGSDIERNVHQRVHYFGFG
ncbi:MAG: hypothetical protein ABI347_01985 [Nitrososphaera sp.]|jgi:hypothetical protein